MNYRILVGMVQLMLASLTCAADWSSSPATQDSKFGYESNTASPAEDTAKADESPVSGGVSRNGYDHEKEFYVMDYNGGQRRVSVVSSSLWGYNLKPYQNNLDYVDHLDGFRWKKIDEADYLRLDLDRKYDILYGRALYFSSSLVGKDLLQSPEVVSKAMVGNRELELAVTDYKQLEMQRKKKAAWIGCGAVAVAYLFYMVSFRVTEGECTTNAYGYYECEPAQIKFQPELLAMAGASLAIGGTWSIMELTSKSNKEKSLLERIQVLVGGSSF